MLRRVRINDPVRRGEADARRAHRRARFLELVEALKERWGLGKRGDAEVAKRIGLSESYVAKVRGRPKTAIGPDATSVVEARLGLASAYWSAESGGYEDFLIGPPQTPSPDWAAFEARHRQSMQQLGPEAAGWIRVAPFRGGISDPSVGWSLALDTALRLHALAADPMKAEGERVRPAAAKLMGPEKT